MVPTWKEVWEINPLFCPQSDTEKPEVSPERPGWRRTRNSHCEERGLEDGALGLGVWRPV